MQSDLTHKILVKPAIEPSAKSADANGLTVDTQGFTSCAFAGNITTATSADIALVVQHSADGTTWANAPADDVFGETISIQGSAANRAFQIGYRGPLRYVRLNVVRVAGSAVIGATCVLGDPRETPTY